MHKSRHEEPGFHHMDTGNEGDIDWSLNSDDENDEPLAKTQRTFQPQIWFGQSGRNKSNAAKHLRSQSVLAFRENLTESDVPSFATKSGTWPFRSKPVSEEWGDDFEFDGGDEVDEAERAKKPASIHGIKVPQSITDRQHSVHIQFRHVQDFMRLVEELKELRLRGTTLGLLESHSRQLWKDAESIVDLATVNEDEKDMPGLQQPGSTESWNILGEDASQTQRVVEGEAGEGGRLGNRRSISDPATEPYLQTKTFLQTIHQDRDGIESSPAEVHSLDHEKLLFDTQDLQDLVVRARVIAGELKSIVSKAEEKASSEIPR